MWRVISPAKGLFPAIAEGANMNLDVKSVVKKLGKLEATLKSKIESGTLINEVKRFANGQVKTIRQKVKSSNDVKKLVSIIEQRKKQIEKIAADLPSEVKSVRSYIKKQRTELEKLGEQLIKQAKAGKLNANSIRSAIQSTRARVLKTSAKVTSKKTTAKKAKKK